MCDFNTLLVLFYVKNAIFSGGGFWHHCLAFHKIIKMNISPGFSDQFLGNKFIYLQDV